MRQSGRSILAVASVVLATAAASPQGASAIDNTVPSRAPVVQLGVPFMATEPNGSPDLWRMDRAVRTGDIVQFAVDNTQGENNATVCLLGPTDDFGYDNEVAAVGCGGLFDDSAGDFVIESGRSDRATATYIRPTGVPLIRVSSLFDTVNQYAITVESVTTLINIGATAPASVGRSFTYVAALRHGDNAVVGDGTTAALEWRKAPKTPGPPAFTPLASAASAGGQVVFQATLPPEAAKKVQLRACVTQPGATRNCTAVATVAVAPLISTACLDARADRAGARRRVVRLARKRALARRAKVRRRVVRRLRGAKRRLRATRQAVATHCP